MEAGGRGEGGAGSTADILRALRGTPAPGEEWVGLGCREGAGPGREPAGQPRKEGWVSRANSPPQPPPCHLEPDCPPKFSLCFFV